MTKREKVISAVVALLSATFGPKVAAIAAAVAQVLLIA